MYKHIKIIFFYNNSTHLACDSGRCTCDKDGNLELHLPNVDPLLPVLLVSVLVDVESLEPLLPVLDEVSVPELPLPSSQILSEQEYPAGQALQEGPDVYGFLPAMFPL